MTSTKALIKGHPVLAYFALTFAISWGAVLVTVGPGAFLGTKEISFLGIGPFAIMAVLAGPSVAGILLTSLTCGKEGFRDVLSRLLRWRVGVRWYIVALLTAPLLTMATLFGLSFTSPIFLPAILTTSDKPRLLLTGIAVGSVVAFLEELGWTGFAIPELRKRYSILGTGLIVGLLWGAWHFPLFAGTAGRSGIPPTLYLSTLLFSWLPPYRVFMVWVYDQTKSLLVLMLMHLVIDVDSFVLVSQNMPGTAIMFYDLIFAGALWGVVLGIVFLKVRYTGL